MSNIITWTPYEQLIYISRILMIIFAAAFFGSLIRISIQMKFKELSVAGKVIIVMLLLYCANIIFFYLGYAITRPTVTFGSLRNIGDIVVLCLGLFMIRHAVIDAQNRNKKPIEPPVENNSGHTEE